MRSTSAILVLALLSGACPPDLDRFRIEGEGGDGDGDGDADGGEGEGEGEPTGGPCPVPHLLVSVEDVRGGPGRVLRFALRDELPLERCGDLTARGQMLGQPFTLAWIDEHRVAVASTNGVQLVDPEDDSLTWNAPHDALWPNDAFRIETPEGVRRLAIAYSNWGGVSGEIRSVRLYDDAGGVLREMFGNGGELPIGLGVASMTQSPVHPDWMLAVKPGSYAAGEIDPWTPAAHTDPAWVMDREGTVLESIFGLAAPPSLDAPPEEVQNRIAWVGRDEAGSHVHYVLGGDGTPGVGVSLPLDCEGRACTFVHAVPDPSMNTRLLALCEEDGDFATRRVVRFRSTATECEVVFEAGTMPAPGDHRLARMSVAWEVP